MRFVHSLLFCVALLAITPAARAHPPRPREARAVWTPRAPRIDGRLDDAVWRAAPVHDGFVERKPRLAARPPVRSWFKVLFDDRGLYVAVRCADDRPGEIRGLSRTRDSFAIFRDDVVSLKIDAGHDHRTTLGFATNPSGARLDYRGVDEDDMVVQHDAVWRAAVSRDERGWSAELAIPWPALGLAPPGKRPRRIGFNVTRDHARRNATYDWALLAPPFSAVASSRYGHLTLPARPASAAAGRAPGRLALAVTPYALGGFERAAPEGGGALATDERLNAGGEVRLAYGAALSAQLTVNTDFAQVDLDDQVVNLTRFGLFLPEKRDFFLRQLDLFSFGREGQAQLLYTRRIGLAGGAEVPITGGLKVVSQLGSRARLGLLQVTTRPGDTAEPWSSHLVARGQLELGRGSNVGMMLTHRQSLEAAADRNLVLGIDGALRGWLAEPLLVRGFALASLTGGQARDPEQGTGASGLAEGADRLAPAADVEIAWRGPLLRLRGRAGHYDPDLRSDLGYLERVGFELLDGGVALEPRIERLGIERLTFEAFGSVVATTEGLSLLDYTTGGAARITWEAGYALVGRYERIHETVLAPFTVGRATTIDRGEHGMHSVEVQLETPATYPASLSASVARRGYYGGTLTSVASTVTVRPAALLRYELSGEHRRARFDDPARSFDSAILNGRVSVGFTPDLGLDGYVAWSSLGELLRLQARLRWSYWPGSDIFLVYQHDLDDDAARTTFASLLLKAAFRWAAL